MLGNGVRGYIRKMTARTLTERCTLQQEELTSGDFGQPLEGWANVEVNLPCRVIKAGATSQDQAEKFAGQDAIEQTYRLIVSFDVVLDTNMRVIVDSETFYVVQLETGLTDRAFRSAIVTRKAGADG